MSYHDVFICYSSKNTETARKVVRLLESRRIRCWIALRDVRPGENYQEAIVRAIRTARLLLMLFTEDSNRSSAVQKELSVASRFDVPVMPLRLSDTALSEALIYELSTSQWIDATSGLAAAADSLIPAVERAIRKKPREDDTVQITSAQVVQEILATRLMAAPPPLPSGPSSARVDAVRTLLSKHVGPLAKIIIAKEMADSPDVDTLCNRLGGYVNEPLERESFLRAVRAHLSAA